MSVDKKLVRIFLEAALISGVLTWIIYWLLMSH